MAFALAVGDICSPAVFSLFAASSEPPIQGVVTKISPTVVVWQDGREVTYTPSTIPGSVDGGLGKFAVDLGSPFMNHRVRPSGTIPVPNLDSRAEGVVVLAGQATNALFDVPVAVVLYDNGLYVVVPQSAIEVVPGA